jgi:SpoVK/Ycf46/Vps4 family AAA+-type ATPase
VAIVIDYAESIAPAVDVASAENDRSALVTLAEWGRDQRIDERGHLVVLIASDLHDVNERLRKSGARWEQIALPFPSFDERVGFLRQLLSEQSQEPPVHLAEGTSYEELARLTTGLRFIDLEDIVLRASFHGQDLSRVLVKQRKDEIMASEYEEVLQVAENEFGFEVLGGLEEVKADLTETVITPMRAGELRVVPQGILLMGPAGTGKTRLARALAKEAGVTFVELQPSKIFSKWVGDTERRLEKALSAIASMTPCIVFIDEIDQAMGRGESGDSGVSNRVFKRLMEVMADTSQRGKVLFVAASNRADLLDAALLRPGRLDKKIPILAPDGRERVNRYAYCGKMERDMLHKGSGTIYFTRALELEWKISYHLSWLARSVYVEVSPPSPILRNRLRFGLRIRSWSLSSNRVLPRYPSQRVSASDERHERRFPDELEGLLQVFLLLISRIRSSATLGVPR